MVPKRSDVSALCYDSFIRCRPFLRLIALTFNHWGLHLGPLSVSFHSLTKEVCFFSRLFLIECRLYLLPYRTLVWCWMETQKHVPVSIPIYVSISVSVWNVGSMILYPQKKKMWEVTGRWVFFMHCARFWKHPDKQTARVKCHSSHACVCGNGHNRWGIK